MQSVPITTNVVISNPAYAIKFVSDLRQVCGFLPGLQFPPPITLHYYLTEILLKVVLNTIILTLGSTLARSVINRLPLLIKIIQLPLTTKHDILLLPI